MLYRSIRLENGLLYHYTSREKAQSILRDGCVRAMGDAYTFFAASEAESRLLFHELMQKPIPYVGKDLRVHRRVVQDAKDYVILCLRVKDDGRFGRLELTCEGFNPYDVSIVHKGDVHFASASVVEMIRPAEEAPMQLTGRFDALRRWTAAAALRP